MKTYNVSNFVVEKSKTIAFAYTVKSLGNDLDADYKPFFDKLERFKVPIEYRVPERDSKGKLHYHGIIYLRKGFYRKKISCQGFHIRLREITDRAGWLRYIHKDVDVDEEDLIDMSENKIILTGSLF